MHKIDYPATANTKETKPVVLFLQKNRPSCYLYLYRHIYVPICTYSENHQTEAWCNHIVWSGSAKHNKMYFYKRVSFILSPSELLLVCRRLSGKCGKCCAVFAFRGSRLWTSNTGWSGSRIVARITGKSTGNLVEGMGPKTWELLLRVTAV